MIPPPFLVPAFLDAISGSKYVSVTKIVPGEADAYCAEAARQTGSIILTNDSDYFVHDLGKTGGFSLLYQAELRASDEEETDGVQGPCRLLRLLVFRPHEIAERLGLADIRRLAFNFTRARHNSLTLPKAIADAKKQEDESSKSFQEFLEEFLTEPAVSESQNFDPKALACVTGQAPLLDPRISELILQLASTGKDAAHMYLPYLIEDPTRFSAWSVSSDQRSFAYSICNVYCQRLTRKSGTIITEFARRGQRITAQQISLISEHDLNSHAIGLKTRFNDFRHTFSHCPIHLIWRTYALFEVYGWYLNTSRNPPSRQTMKRAMIGPLKPRLTWEDVHLHALIQAVLYALRMIQQILAYTVSAAAKPSKPLIDLASILTELPSLSKLIPSRFELAGQPPEFGIDELLDRLAKTLQDDANFPDAIQVRDNEEETDAKP